MQAMLTGKKILITGASRGIGAGIAKVLAAQGAQIAITYASKKEQAEQVLASLEGSGHQCYALDIRDEASILNCIEQFLKDFGRIDGLVNNAGITKDQILLRMKASDFDDVVQTNLRGGFLCTKAVLKPMMKQNSGSIVNITSIIGQTGNAGQANYAASKAGLEAFAKSVAQEMASRNIRVNCVAPGYIATEMTDVLDDKQKEQMLANIPLKRVGQVDDIAYAVSFLLSEQANYITGQTLSVNGGMNM